MAYINLLLLIIFITIWVFILALIYKVERIRLDSLNLIRDIAYQIKEVKQDFKDIKSSINKY